MDRSWRRDDKEWGVQEERVQRFGLVKVSWILRFAQNDGGLGGGLAESSLRQCCYAIGAHKRTGNLIFRQGEHGFVDVVGLGQDFVF